MHFASKDTSEFGMMKQTVSKSEMTKQTVVTVQE